MKKTITLDHQADYETWRDHALREILKSTAPDLLLWQVKGDTQNDLFALEAEPEPKMAGSISVPSTFPNLAQTALCHRDPTRFALLYRVLWRLQTQKHLLANKADPDVYKLFAMASAVRRDRHKMKAFVRFRKISERKTEDGEVREIFVSWFEPDHFICRITAPFFAKRFTGMDFTIVTPDESLHWDGNKLHFGNGGKKSDILSQERMEDHWRTYYGAIFNPARVKIKAMQSEMPKKYWKNLPEAETIVPLIQEAERRVDTMLENQRDMQSRMDKALQRKVKSNSSHLD